MLHIEIHNLEVNEIANSKLYISFLCAETLLWNALTWDLPSQEADVDKTGKDLAANFRDASRKTDNTGRDEKHKTFRTSLLLWHENTCQGRSQRGHSPPERDLGHS